jgi:hypothetical protein
VTQKLQKDTESLLIEGEQPSIEYLIRRVEKGDAQARETLRVTLSRLDERVRRAGNLAAKVEQILLSRWSKGDGKEDVLSRELMKLELESLKKELAGPNPHPLEQLLVERIALCWIQMQETILMELAAQKTGNLSAAEYHANRQERANRMFLAAVKALAQIRKLQVPNIQVNIADKQIIAQQAIQ